MKSLGGRPEAFDLEPSDPHRGGLKLPAAGPRRGPGVLIGSGSAVNAADVLSLWAVVSRDVLQNRTSAGVLARRFFSPPFRSWPLCSGLALRCIVSVRTLLTRHGDEHIRQTASAMGQYLTGQIREWKRKDVYSAGQVAFPPFAFIREWGQNGTVVKSPAWTPAS